MNKQIIILIIIGSGLAVFCRVQDISSYLTDKRFIDKELHCLLETGDCDGLGKQIKRVLPVVLKDKCRRCTPLQKANLYKLIQFLQSRYPTQWRTIEEMYSSPTHFNENK
ncbi:ejaculatory bulb-specific protein 3-like [Camponotus floridanus]|uniref:ejaculatory bulb-specific protein 3-like n=1 Tax=Camponotus floridanus TaxID=104421 RepID=UPI00059E4EA5|nr:ejaculatory bulb-specific protein 3-like [Camponotus floridanus]